jgi:DNA-binding transcriptional LysR family regulator
MKIQHLRFFAAVVDCGGVVKAAERLHVSQPAVSAGLKTLEQELGQPLFERTGGRRLRPTSKAIDFHQHALEILRQCDVARARFRSPESKSTKLRLGVLQTVAAIDVAAFAATLARQDPDLKVQVREGGPVRLAEWLRQGRIDAIWTVVEKSGAHARALWRERFVMLVSRTHPLGQNRRAKIPMADLADENIVLRTCCEMKRGQLWPIGFRMRVAARTDRDELALRLVAQGLGIAIAPQSLATPDVVARPIHDLEATRSIGLKWRADLPPKLLAQMLDAMTSIKPAGTKRIASR